VLPGSKAAGAAPRAGHIATDDISPATNHCERTTAQTGKAGLPLHTDGARSLPEDDKRAYCAKRHMDIQV